MTSRLVVRHGTLEGFLEHRRLNEAACTACRQAWKRPWLADPRYGWHTQLVWALWRLLWPR